MSKRSYKQNCALAQASDVIGERWSLLLIRDLLIGPRRFGELQKSLRGLGSNLLALRLRELESAGIIFRLTDSQFHHHYGLTKAGKALEPTILSLVRWGLSYGPESQNDHHHQDDWDLLALKALFRADRVGDLSVCVQFKTNEFTGWIAIHDQNAKIGLGESDSVDVIVNGTIKDLILGPHDAQLCSSGPKRKLKQFMRAFTLPAKSRHDGL